MIQRDIEIINECWNDKEKFNKILSFNSAEETIKCSIVLNRYYLWYLKHKLKINVERGHEKELLADRLNSSKDKEEKIDINYCLGELTLEEDKEESNSYFQYVTDKYNDNYYVDKNLFYMAKFILEGKKKHTLEQDVVCYEINYLKFNNFDKELFSKEYIDAALWLSNKCANYKNTMELVWNYFNKHNSFENLSLSLINAYELTNDGTYICDLIGAISKTEELDNDLKEKIFRILNSLNDIGLWGKLLKIFYEKIDVNDIERILINVDSRLEYTSLYTGELVGESEVVFLLARIYKDVVKLKNKYVYMEEYEKNIIKYLIYASYQNNCIPEMYESYSKLEAFNKIDSNSMSNEELSIIKCIENVKVPNKDKLKKINVYPFEDLINNLKSTLDGTKVFETVQNRIANITGNESIESTLNSIMELIKLSNEELINLKNSKSETFNERIRKIDETTLKIQELKETDTNMLDNYFKYIERAIDKFKKDINLFIVESIAEIYSNIPEYIKRIKNSETIYEEVKFKLKNDINDWGRSEYNNFIKEKLFLLLQDIAKYIVSQNENMNSQVEDLKEQCVDIYDFEEHLLYERLNVEELMKTLSNNSGILLQYIYINIDEMIRKNNSFDMGLQKPRLSNISTGLSKLFNQEDETLNKHKQHIRDNIQSAAKQTIEFIQKNIENIDILFESMICIVFENTYSINEGIEKYMINKGCCINAVSNNIENINKYCNDIEELEKNIKDIKTYIIERNAESIKLIEEKLVDIKKLNIDIAKYENQISNGILYKDGELFRIKNNTSK